MLTADEYYQQRYQKVCHNHTDYIEFAGVYAVYVLTYYQAKQEG